MGKRIDKANDILDTGSDIAKGVAIGSSVSSAIATATAPTLLGSTTLGSIGASVGIIAASPLFVSAGVIGGVVGAGYIGIKAAKRFSRK